jgi:hypothetical protein
MNFLAGLLLFYMPDEAHAFAGLVMLMRDRNLKPYYGRSMSLLQVTRNRGRNVLNHAVLCTASAGLFITEKGSHSNTQNYARCVLHLLIPPAMTVQRRCMALLPHNQAACSTMLDGGIRAKQQHPT